MGTAVVQSSELLDGAVPVHLLGTAEVPLSRAPDPTKQCFYFFF